MGYTLRRCENYSPSKGTEVKKGIWDKMIGSELNMLSLKHLRNSLVEVRSKMLGIISWSSEDWPEIEIHTRYSGH